MKTKIFKIIITLVTSLFLCASGSMADDKKGKNHKPQGKAYGYHKDDKGHGHQAVWHKKQYKSYRHRHRPQGHYHRHYYYKGHWPPARWYRNHYKSYHLKQRPRQPYPKHHDHYKLHDQHGRPYKRKPHRDGFILGMSFNDPYMSVLIGAKGN